MASETALPASLKDLFDLLGTTSEEMLLSQSIHLKAISALVEELAETKNRLAERESHIQDLERQMDEDPAVPVLNRRAWTRELQRAIALARRTGRAGSVLFFDVNGLKKVNDRFGHRIGDRVIERVAKTLVIDCRASDLVGRLGGDEFAVLMPETPPAGALIRGKRVSDILKKVPLMAGEAALTLSAAYGASPFTGTESATDVLAAADAAMYKQKNGK